MDLIKERNDAIIALRTLHKQEKEIISIVESVETLYRKRIQTLEEEKSQAISKAEGAKAHKIAQLDLLRIPLNAVIKQYEKIMSYMNLYMNKRDLKNFENPIKILYEDPYSIFVLKISKFGKNSRTNNYYTLYLEGNSIFQDLFNRNQFHFYGITEIQRAPSEKDLIEYMDRPMNFKKIMDRIPMGAILIMKKEYEEAIELLKDEKWQIEYLKQKKYYYEVNVFRGTEEPEYKKILKQIEELIT